MVKELVNYLHNLYLNHEINNWYFTESYGVWKFAVGLSYMGYNKEYKGKQIYDMICKCCDVWLPDIHTYDECIRDDYYGREFHIVVPVESDGLDIDYIKLYSNPLQTFAVRDVLSIIRASKE